MQTFLPNQDFSICAAVLDDKRLDCQRLEAWHLLEIISGQTPDSKWKNHPLVKMWWGYDSFLRQYGIFICLAWRGRGHKDSIYPKFSAYSPKNYTIPWWLGNINLHLSHQSNLLRKNPEHYGKYFLKTVPTDLPYLWPQSDLLIEPPALV